MQDSNKSLIEPSSKLPLLVWPNDAILPGSGARIPLLSTIQIELLKSKILLKDNEERSIFGVIPRSPDKDHDLKNIIGTAVVLQSIEPYSSSPFNLTLVVSGFCRIRVEQIIQVSPYIVGHVSVVESCSDIENLDPILLEELMNKIREFHGKQHSNTYLNRIKPILAKGNLETILDSVAAYLPGHAKNRFEFLNAMQITKRMEILRAILDEQIKVNKLFKENRDKLLNPKMKSQLVPIPSGMRSYFNKDKNEIWLTRMKEANLPEKIEKIAKNELERMNSSMSIETQVIRQYLDLLLDLPWSKSTVEKIDIEHSRKVLDLYHYGMHKQKRRILEYLAVKRLRPNAKGPILCFSGPPGTGKTSIASSIAQAIGKKFYRISLGGIHNQTTIRGHSRTYVASQPGKIIQALRQVGTNNPVILLDEIDKLTSEKLGDPAAALLEVLDPEQNCSFVDHYLNIPFDLSRVMFIGTANSTQNMPEALLDRLEVIPIDGYSMHEKISIAENYLIPKQILENGLLLDKLTITKKSIESIIDGYTREAGLRNLERSIAKLCRHIAYTYPPPIKSEPIESPTQDSKENSNEIKNYIETTDNYEPTTIDENHLEQILGPRLFMMPNFADRLRKPGACLGLACNKYGGSVVVIEANMMDGKGKLILTGSLGDVMQESVNIAYAWIRTNASLIGLDLSWRHLSKFDIHVHFPEGAVSKDGPSGGIAITTALVSLFSKRCVRSDLALTGEITLTGKVLPVGGIPSKVLAAQRAGISQVVIPMNCENALADIPEEHLKSLQVFKVSTMEEVLGLVFEGGIRSLASDSITRAFFPSKL